jgi:berberine-like enzyme
MAIRTPQAPAAVDRRAADNYGASYERLCAVEAAYDPDNLRHVNQNIAPVKWR